MERASDPPGVSLAPADGGRATLLPVRAQPGARRPGVLGVRDGHLRVAVRAPAQDGRANEELLEVLAERLGLRPRALELVRGARGRQKLLRVALPPAELARRLATLLGPGGAEPPPPGAGPPRGEAP